MRLMAISMPFYSYYLINMSTRAGLFVRTSDAHKAVLDTFHKRWQFRIAHFCSVSCSSLGFRT
jgi:hypothetical protein